MRNLRNTEHCRFKFGGQHASTNLSATAWDATDDSLILAFGPSASDRSISLKRLSHNASDGEDAKPIASWDAPSPNPDLAVDKIFNLHYFPDTKSTNLILAGGDIVVVREEPQSDEDLIEIVGSVDAGINAAAWSPDEELLAISTGAETLLLMTRDFETIANITLSPEDVKVSDHVSVGWGKKETQFKGRGVAKALRDPTVPEHVDEGKPSSFDDGEVSISWRGDGQFIAVNTVLQAASGRRIIRVYSREGVLESVCEPVDGLEGALSWKPSGQLIAGVQRREESLDVIFFERNGLRHGEFSLRLSKDEIQAFGSTINLDWNNDSTVLAVSMKDRVQLWTMGNYHYYLKQAVLLDSKSSSVATPQWHPEKALHICCSGAMELHSLSYRMEICRGSVAPPHDLGIVGVIDGKNLKVTPLRSTNMPPPMAFDEVELPQNALDVDINDQGTKIAVLHHGAVSFWACDYSLKPPRRAVLTSLIEITKLRRETLPDNLYLDQKDRASVVVSDHVVARTDHDRIAYLNAGGGYHAIYTDVSDPCKTSWRGEGSEDVSFRLTETGVLNILSSLQTLRITGCSSFIVTPTHLVFTTGQHLLKFIHLHSGELELPPDEPEKDERCRSIERGAKIVTVMPSAYALVLQMPRGNLETIYPRALVLAGIRKSLRERDYKKAYLTCRTHRVDMNILHDYLPERFMQDIELFIEQIKRNEYVDLFLSSLSEDNVCETLYRETFTPIDRPLTNGVGNGMANEEIPDHSSIQSSKVNRICHAFLHVLLKQSATRLQNIVTAHVCKSPPDLEAGLRLVANLRALQNDERLEQAVEHICFLADVNQLYDTALGFYDLDVALLVAQQSQKDPREYLPYLQELQDTEDMRRRFKIDNDLKRHRKALGHLHALDAFEELKPYTIRHDLYSAAIDLYKYDERRLMELMRLHADHLLSRNRFKEAGIAFEFVAEHTAAMEAFRAVSMWRECLSNAALVPVEPQDLVGLAQDLASSLEESKDFAGAAMIHTDYLNDLVGAIRLLCQGHQFTEAIRKVTLQKRSDLLQSAIDPGLIEASATMTELLADMKSQLGAQLPRLRELRRKEADDPMAFLDGADGGDADVPDNISLAPTDASTSGGTFMTQYTNRSTGTLATNATRKTSKNRRREERKRARGKKGTVYEEEYLVNSIARLIERLNDVRDDSNALVEGLLRRRMRERAFAVQSVMEDVWSACNDCMEEVFRPGNEVDTHEGLDGDTKRPWGGQGILFDALKSSKREQILLKPLERLTLLT